MRSIPAAMTWEILRRGRWPFVSGILIAISFPAMILLALRHDGGVDLQDKSMLVMQIVMLQLGMFEFGAMLYGSQGKMSLLYAYPARTSELVAWRLLPMMVLIALATVINVGVLNAIFGLNWPIWGPALFAAVAIAAVMAVAWLTEKSIAWTVVGLSIVSTPLALWFKSRYGHTFSDPTHRWEQLTAGEVLTMIAIAAGSYWVAVRAVARNRRGDPPLSLGLLDWLERTFNLSAADVARLTTPFQAQCWLEWRRKGWAMPITGFTLLVFGLIIWLFASRSAEDLFQGLLMGGHVLWFVAFIGGVLLGNVGPNESNYTMGHFMATRPMSDAGMGHVVLRTAIKSILLTWSIWVGAFLVGCGCLLACGARDVMKLPSDWSWWYVPGNLLGPWILIGVLMSLLLLGHSRFLTVLACAIPAAIIVIAVISKFFLSREAQLITGRTIIALSTIGLVIVCVAVFIAARRRGLIQSSTILASAVVWATATAVLSFQWPQSATAHWTGYLVIAALIALLVAPLGSVPLAISLNRHR